MIEQVIMNLILNSRDAMPHGGRIDLDVREITIGPDEIDRHPGGRPGRFLQLGVSDTGSGIAPEDLTRIFEPFFTTKPAGKGTGLGLVTVFGIVKQHAGWIEVTSELGHGTTFLLFLPVAATTAAEPVQPVYPARMQGGHETILLAEDDENIRQLLQGSLERHGYRVLVAATGPEAMEQISLCGAQVDLLIADLIMPDGMNGRDLAQRLLASAPNLKVIYISGYAGEGPAAELKLEPGVNFLRKPFALETIVALVRRRLDEADLSAARPV